MENVTQERAKWRTKIRELSLVTHRASCSGDLNRLGELVMEFATNLNPFHAEDEAVIDIVYKLSTTSDKDILLLEFRERISLLLKHDWQRAKYEALPWFFRIVEPKRVSYESYKSNNSAIKQSSIKSSGSKLDWNIKYAKAFIWLMLSGAFLFFISAYFADPFKELVKVMNDNKPKPMNSWYFFLIMSLAVGSIWGSAWVIFKYAEKKCVDLLNQ